MNKIFLVILMSIFSVGLCFGQETEDNPTIVEDKPSACEMVPLNLDRIMIGIRDRNEKVTAIFRAGKNETEITNTNRLSYVKWYWHKHYGKVAANIIYTRGEKSLNEGKIDFYIKGKLDLVIISPLNMTPCLDCCGDSIYYPQNLLKKRKLKKRRK